MISSVANLGEAGALEAVVLKIRIRNWSAVFKDGIFYRLLHCCPIENVWDNHNRFWPSEC